MAVGEDPRGLRLEKEPGGTGQREGIQSSFLGTFESDTSEWGD